MPKIAILGFAIECNQFAPVSTRADFESRCLLGGDALIAEARSAAPAMTPEIPAFVRAMDQAGAWTPAPILLGIAEAGGPVEHEFFEEMCAAFRKGLQAAMPLDAVYICEHGAGITTGDRDPDGAVFALVREIVGPNIPIVATVDLHANISDRMVDSVDVLISYKRNPHTDMAERGAEAAATLNELLGGMKPSVAHIRMPICSPPTQLLTARGQGPYADMIEAAEAIDHPGIVNISILGGFAYGDTPKNGLTIIVTTRQDPALAQQTAEQLAALGWRERARFAPELTSPEQAIALAKATGDDASRLPILLADVADNPGGGGRGNTPFLLRQLLEADVKGVLFGVFTDPALSAEAHAKGEGAQFDAVFNRDETTIFSEKFQAKATVLQLHDGKGVGRRGQLAGCTFDLGPCAALQVGGVTIIVITHRHQCHEPMMLEMFGYDIAKARIVVVKSRGHFRAAFDEFFPAERIISVDEPGLTSPILSRFDFTHLPRPVIPLDTVASWTPAARMVTARNSQ
jgi:microcystin degradation protein MlrC